MKTTLARLLKYPHAAVFDKSPEQAGAFRLRHANGASWVIGDAVMTAHAGEVEHIFTLDTMTVGQLASALAVNGFEVLSLSSDFTSRSALVLVETTGNERQSNGDSVFAYTSVLWTLLGGFAGELRGAKEQVIEALRQMVITQSEGEWLDLWGTLYAVPRKSGEPDAGYASRIPVEAARLRCNPRGIELAIRDATGYEVEIREPWRQMFTLDVSRLSGADHLRDTTFYTHHIIQPVARAPIDWTGVLDLIERNRPAGVLVRSPSMELPTRHIIAAPPMPWRVARSIEISYAMAAWQGGDRPLGVMRLDDNEITLNHPMMAYQARTYANADGLHGDQVFGRAREVAYAAIALSDGVRLGDENAILSRGQMFIEQIPPPTPSSQLALSDYSADAVVRRVERVTLSLHAAWSTGILAAGGYSCWRDERHAFWLDFHANTVNAWSGPWDNRSWLGWRRVGMAMSSTPA